MSNFYCLPGRAGGTPIVLAGALRNVGLALLVATTNQAPPVVQVVIVSYALTAIIIVTAYIPLRDNLYHRSRTN